MPPIIDETGETDDDIQSCFVTTNEQLSADNHQFILGLDLQSSYFQHAIVLVHDFYDGLWYEYNETNNFF